MELVPVDDAPIHYSSGALACLSERFSHLIQRPQRDATETLWAELGMSMEAREVELLKSLVNSSNASEEEVVEQIRRMSLSSASVATAEASLLSAPVSVNQPEPRKFASALRRISGVKGGLKILSEFVRGHTKRKILNAWNFIEPRFARTPFFVVHAKKDERGLSYNYKIPAVPLSVLTSLLCSTKIKVSFLEIHEIFEKIDCTKEDIFLARRITAVKALLGPKNGEGVKQAEQLQAELKELLEKTEKLVTLEELRGEIFSEDPEARAKEMEHVEEEKAKMVGTMLAEKGMREDAKAKAEARRIRSIQTFEATLAEIQFVRTTFTKKRSHILGDVVEYCRQSVAAMHASKDVTLPVELISLLGLDAFPTFVQDIITKEAEVSNAASAASSVTSQSRKTRDSSDRGANKKIDGKAIAAVEEVESDISDDEDGEAHVSISVPKLAPAVAMTREMIREKTFCRISLAGPPTILELLRETVSYSKGLNGLSYRDVVEMLQAYCSIHIQAAFRGYLRHRSYFKARDRWTKIFSGIKRKCFLAWKKSSRYSLDLLLYCFRPLKAWRFYTKRSGLRREFFRQCFWPFYVWRRVAVARATAKAKTKFLVSRVMPTVLEIKVFNGWKKFIEEKCRVKRKADNQHRKTLMKRARTALRFMHFSASGRRHLRRIWMRGGLSIFRRQLALRKSTPIQLWYTYIQYRKEAEIRSNINGATFRKLLLPNTPPIPPPNKAEKRAKIKQISFQKRKSMAIVRRRKEREKERMIEERRRRFEEFSSNGSVSSGGFSRTNSNSVNSTSQASHHPSDDEIDDNDPLIKKMVDIDAIDRISTILYGARDTPFLWVRSDHSSFEFDSDGEDIDGIPAQVTELYDKHIEPIMNPSVLNIKWGDSWIAKRVDGVVNGFKLVEKWSIFEAAMRFHRFGHRVLQNLYVHAIVRRNARISVRDYQLKQKRLVFYGFLRWMLRDAKSGFLTMEQSDGEKIRESVRNIRWGKMIRRRELTAQIRASIRSGALVDEDEEEFSDIEILDDATRKRRRMQELKRYTKWSGTDEDLRRMDPVSMRKRRITPSEKRAILESSGDEVPSTGRGKGLFATLLTSSKGSNTISLNATQLHAIVGSPRTTEAPEAAQQPSPQRKLGRKSVSGKSAIKPPQKDNEAEKKKAGQLSKKTVSAVKERDRVEREQLKKKIKAKTSMEKANGRQESTAHSITFATGTASTTVDDDAAKNGDIRSSELAMILPNMLEWDREDRETDASLADQLIDHAKAVRAKAVAMSVESTLVTDALNKGIMARDAMAAEVMTVERDATQEAVQLELAYCKNFKVDAARILLDVLVKIREEMLATMLKVKLKKYFRCLRTPMLRKRSMPIYNRKKMINWLRICRRLRSMETHAPFYNRIRCMWTTFNRWLKYLEKEMLDCTPGLVRELKRRNQLYPRFSQLLEQRNFIKVVYYNNRRIERASSDPHGIFARWLSYTHERVVFRKLKTLCVRLYRLKLMQTCFWALYLYMQRKETRAVRSKMKFFPFIRLESDIAQIAKRFCARRKSSLAYAIIKYNRSFLKKLKAEGRKAPSFKKFVKKYNQEVTKRLATEQRIMVESFEERGNQKFQDIHVPSRKNRQLVPEVMQRVEGEHFADPVPTGKYFHVDDGTRSRLHSGQGHSENHGGGAPAELSESHVEEVFIGPGHITGLPPGFKLHKIRLNILENMGIIGWQVNWCADGLRDVDAPRRGRWYGGATSVHELIIPRGEFAVGMEYQHDGSIMCGLRFKLFGGGWTKWIGGKITLATQTVYLGAEHADKLPFDDEYVSAGQDETVNPAFPRAYIVGLTGVDTHARCTNIGIIVRKVHTQHLLSYCWVKDRLDSILAEMSQAAVAGNSLVMDVQFPAIPGHVEGQHTVPGEESLTMNSSRGQLPPIASRPNTTIGSSRVQTAGNHNEWETGSTMPSARSQDTELVSNAEISEAHGGQGSVNGQSNASSNNVDEVRTHRSMTMTEAGFGYEEPLMSSETQFFDALRMRTIEITMAQDRCMQFARRLWTKVQFRNHPEYQAITKVHIVTNLAAWMFNAVSKRLLKLRETEKEGTELQNEASNIRKKAEVLETRSNFAITSARTMEATPQSWTGKSLLSPHERALRKFYKDRIRNFVLDSKKFREESIQLRGEALEMEKRAALLLPRYQLSKYNVGNFMKKLAAARHKEMLVQFIPIDVVKSAIMGTGEKTTGLPDADMESVLTNLKNRKVAHVEIELLEDLVENEMQKERARVARMAALPPSESTYDPQQGRSMTVKRPVGSSLDFSMTDDFEPTENKRKKRVLAVDPKKYFSKTNYERPLPLISKSRSERLSASTSALPPSSDHRLPSAIVPMGTLLSSSQSFSASLHSESITTLGSGDLEKNAMTAEDMHPLHQSLPALSSAKRGKRKPGREGKNRTHIRYTIQDHSLTNRSHQSIEQSPSTSKSLKARIDLHDKVEVGGSDESDTDGQLPSQPSNRHKGKRDISSPPLRSLSRKEQR